MIHLVCNVEIPRTIHAYPGRKKPPLFRRSAVSEAKQAPCASGHGGDEARPAVHLSDEVPIRNEEVSGIVFEHVFGAGQSRADRRASIAGRTTDPSTSGHCGDDAGGIHLPNPPGLVQENGIALIGDVEVARSVDENILRGVKDRSCRRPSVTGTAFCRISPGQRRNRAGRKVRHHGTWRRGGGRGR